MADQYFVGRGGKRSGPFSVAQLRRIAADGRLLLTDTIWRAGMKSPVLASGVKDLFPSQLRQAPAAEVVELAPALALVQAAVADLPTTEIPIPSDSSPEISLPVPDGMGLSPLGAPPPSVTPPVRQPEPVRKRRAVAVTGAVLLGQDGVSVHYRKKCSTCGNEDDCRSSMLIGNGPSRASFFCKKCRKSRAVEIRGMPQ